SVITGQVPLGVTGGRLRRRMFSSELDELYDLQKEKDRLVAEWKSLNRHWAGSGWTIQDLLDELHPELGLSTGEPVDVPSGGADDEGVVVHGAGSIAAVGGGGGICGGDDPGVDTFAIEPPTPTPHPELSEESAARKVVLDGLLDVYGKADAAGCLEAGFTYCEFSVKEFALEAIPNVNEVEQDAYEECLAILPPPLAGKPGQTRKIVDPVADTQSVTVPDELSDEYELLLDLQCFADVDETMTATHMHWIAARTEECRARIPAYQAMLTAFLEDVALAEAKARLASVPELLDPDTGKIVKPGHSASWDEHKGSKYFCIGMPCAQA